MGNMSYCRFRNTLEDLRDCFDNWDDLEENQKEEERARQRILKLCKQIVECYGDEDE